MDFVAVMLFTQQLFHLECLLLFQIKSQLGVAYKSAVYKKPFNVVFESSKNEEIVLPHEFVFVLIRYFIGEILMEKSCQKFGVDGKNIKRDGHIGREGGGGGRLSVEGEPAFELFEFHFGIDL